jgi:hypothetical protein
MTGLPLKQRSHVCLLIAHDAQASKHSNWFVVVGGGPAYAGYASRDPESLPRSL